MQCLFFSSLFCFGDFVSVLVGCGNYIYHYKDFRLAKKYTSNILKLHQNGVFIFFVMISPTGNVFSKVFDKPKEFQEMLLLKFTTMESSTIILAFLSLILFISGISYSLISQKKYLEQIKSVKPFLKYLKPN